MPWLCCHRTPKSKREDQYKVADDPEEQPAVEKSHQGEAMFSWDRRPQMDIDKYRIHDLDGVTEVRRDVAGQPLAIENCKNSNLLVLENTSTITVDDCTDCLIVLAPCAGSVFLRECHSCTVLVACQQLRTRDCRTLRIALHCTTQPIIEETWNAVFYPLTLHYSSFLDDMIGAHLSPFSSHNTSVYDFTPEQGCLHYRISDDVLPLSTDHVCVLTSNGVSANVDDSDIPVRQEKIGMSHYYYTRCSDDEQRFPFVERCQKVAQAVTVSPSLRLVSTNEIDLQQHGTKIGMPSKARATLVVLEVCGDDIMADQLMSDGGFEKVPTHEESTFATALAAIKQIMVS